MGRQGLTIVIPALDEEGAIADIIERCLGATDAIRETAGLDFVETIVVSDGSTDRTAEIARGYEGIELVVFEQNRGYGAAIQEGWRRGSGNLLGFLDADGTCDPLYFAEMCRLMVAEPVDIVLGSRLGPDSKMPLVRRIGNRFYALLLGFLCGRNVTDAASGMRVVRREALDELYPLPNGLHFTPSMSARAMLNNLRVVEIPMRYEERVGDSTLSVVADGVRFLRTIIEGVLCYRPERILLLAFAFFVLLALLMGATPTEFYARNRRLEEWMIYRFVACGMLGSAGLLLLLATSLANRMARFSRRRVDGETFWAPLIRVAFGPRSLIVLIALLVAASGWSLWPGLVEYATTGGVTLHWSRLLAGALGLLSAFQCAVFAVLMEVVAVWQANATQPPSRTSPTEP